MKWVDAGEIERRVALDRLAHEVIGCAHRVGAKLGHGFIERVYENALCIEMERAALKYSRQRSFQVSYDDRVVGDFIADLVVDERLLVELKAVGRLVDSHRMQCLNYLRASGLPLCLLLNFGNARVEIKRVVHHF